MPTSHQESLITLYFDTEYSCRHLATPKEEPILKMNFIRLSTKPNIIKVSRHTIALVLLLTFF